MASDGVRAASAANGPEQPLGQALELLATQLADKEVVINDLRRWLDRADEQRQQAQTQLAAVVQQGGLGSTIMRLPGRKRGMGDG